MAVTVETQDKQMRSNVDITRGDNVQDQINNATNVSSQSSGREKHSNLSGESEPRGNRLLLFNTVIEKSLLKFMSDARFHRASQIFHPLYKKNPQETEKIHKQFIEHLQRSIQDDITKLIEEGDLQCKLDKLDQLGAASNSQDAAWRPSGVPEQDLCSFVMSYYMKQEAYLKRELRKIREENTALAERVQAGREGIGRTEQHIATTVDEWKVSAQASFNEFQILSSSPCPPATFDV
ncbi:polyamine-modulated factor 1 [Esox lucius]|uniref:Polyamine-modulated factor 1 n=1 Tax=Esox lucius TaxID=8010 RepID=C1BZ28_ESOLU|nr:polyamine-modulated factor 1 [Esox lucius]ACO14281.1 Polyamine-modulated factor 1 [Esox lucius]